MLVLKRLVFKNKFAAALCVFSAGIAASCNESAPAHEAWRTNLRTLEEFVAGEPGITEDEISEAVRFFEGLTGIDIKLDVQYHIPIPTEETAAGIQQLTRWYAKNRDRLAWDPTNGTVRLSE